MIVILLGPPGSGKGTQAKILWNTRKWPQLSTGDMLRSAIEKGSSLGLEAKSFMEQGKLVPDELVIGLIQERLQQDDCHDGVVLDGFPRNISQANALDKMLHSQGRKVESVVLFGIPDEEIVKRISGRRTCVQCGAMYHVIAAPPKEADRCNQCGHSLVQRSDDQPGVVQERLAVYHRQTEPLVGFYDMQNKLKSIDARMSAPEVTSALSEALK